MSNSPFASSIFAPGVEDAMTEFGSTNTALASFVVSIYLIGYAFGPLVIAPLSEIYGRMLLYNACNLLFLIFTIACALAPNLSSLIIFRLFTGIAACCPVVIGAGSIADMIQRERRGAAMSAWIVGPVFGPAVGPIGMPRCMFPQKNMIN
jgi:MFS family permease